METITLFFREIITSQLSLLTLTIAAYYVARALYSRYPIMIFTPIVVATVIIISFLLATNIEFEQYYNANDMLNFTLGVSVICFGYLMHKNISKIKEYKFSILVSAFIGSIVGVVSVVLIARLLGCEDAIILSIEPKSVTMPIALSIADSIGGIPAITSLSVVVAGVFGNIAGAKILKIVKVEDSIAKGLALGSASHVIGTARATEIGPIEGAVGGAAIGVVGIITSLIIPIINHILG